MLEENEGIIIKYEITLVVDVMRITHKKSFHNELNKEAGAMKAESF